jgi:hypothetical protein
VSGRTLRFVERRAQAGEPRPATDVIVLDTWWTPGAGDHPTVVPLRPVIARILADVDLVNGSLDRLDAWAAAAGLPDRFVVDGTTWWFKVRMVVRWDLHELMIWQRVLAEVAPAGRYETIEIPWRRTALVAAARAHAAAGGGSGDARPGPRVVTRHQRRDVRDLYARLRRFAGQRWRIRWAVGAARGLVPSVRTRRTVLEARIAGLAADPPRVLAIAWAGAFHVVRDSGGDRRMDPHLTLVLDRVEAEGSRVAMVMEGLDHQSRGDWPTIAGDKRVIPQSIVDERGWSGRDGQVGPDPSPREPGADHVPLDVDKVDLGPAMQRIVGGYAGPWLAAQVRATGWAERFLAAIRPGALYLDREGTRTKWIVAARRLAIPVVAIQHGMIYPGNPEYCHPAHPAALRPDVTCVFGDAERDLLMEEGGYPADVVAVTGSPRADPEAVRGPAAPDERATVRRELGVADGDRLLVVSVAHNQVMGDLYSAEMVARLLGGSLPGVHVVVKIHPQDHGRAGYGRLLAGLAAAGGYAPPPVTMIRDVDLYRLLRSADAHLGEYSTVLTDAVVAGTPNMIAVGQAYADPLDHVGAGVAVAVRSVDDVRAFLADPRPPTDADRERFLARHFEPGDAPGRIAELLAERRA